MICLVPTGISCGFRTHHMHGYVGTLQPLLLWTCPLHRDILGRTFGSDTPPKSAAWGGMGGKPPAGVPSLRQVSSTKTVGGGTRPCCYLWAVQEALPCGLLDFSPRGGTGIAVKDAACPGDAAGCDCATLQGPLEQRVIKWSGTPS
eukprot:scaffold200191_cov22-Tisochrysis_lutea.AAC.1